MINEIKIVIGSWGSYNECNERALGSNWLTLNDFSSVDELKAELVREGFELDGIDEELFVQDIEGIDLDNCDYTNPLCLFETLLESGVLEDEYAYECMCAIIEVDNFSTFVSEVEKYGANFMDSYIFYSGRTLEDLAYEFVEEMGLPEIATRYFDYEQYARDLSFDGYTETENGVICAC